MHANFYSLTSNMINLYKFHDANKLIDWFFQLNGKVCTVQKKIDKLWTKVIS